MCKSARSRHRRRGWSRCGRRPRSCRHRPHCSSQSHHSPTSHAPGSLATTATTHTQGGEVTWKQFPASLAPVFFAFGIHRSCGASALEAFAMVLQLPSLCWDWFAPLARRDSRPHRLFFLCVVPARPQLNLPGALSTRSYVNSLAGAGRTPHFKVTLNTRYPA